MSVLTRYRTRVAVVVAALLLPAMAPAAAGAADTGDVLSVKSVVVPGVTPSVSLKEALSSQAWRNWRADGGGDGAAGGVVAAETVGPARTAGRLAERPSAVPPSDGGGMSAAAPNPPVYPEPPRTMTLKECLDGLATRPFVIKSKFAACSGASFHQAWLRNGKPQGESRFIVVAIGTMPKNSRTITYTYHYTDMLTTGTAPTAGFLITTLPRHPQTWPSTAKRREGGTVPKTGVSFNQLKILKTFQHTVTVDAGQGDKKKKDDRVFSVYEPLIKLTPPPGYTMNGAREGKLFMLPPRWDAATYLHNKNGTAGKPATKGAAAFAYISILRYSAKAGAEEKAVADHIRTAFQRPGATKPVNPNKSVPGGEAARALTRLYHDGKRHKRNRAAAVRTCVHYWGPNYTAGGKECDEFPFASTYQGAAQKTDEPSAPADNYSALPLPKADNSKAGSMLGAFMDRYRILDGLTSSPDTSDDAYFVVIS
ncbi:hypothetical protein AB0G74_16515 [Streptomyces sp. NPDC020875]|uniref:NucA/NucB deoxyribonuclease domain-containing protein n=1 Tax=Streptomyces sp. NPDC020875 TaxID=3154898 RepID=UPI0033F21DFD